MDKYILESLTSWDDYDNEKFARKCLGEACELLGEGLGEYISRKAKEHIGDPLKRNVGDPIKKAAKTTGKVAAAGAAAYGLAKILGFGYKTYKAWKKQGKEEKAKKMQIATLKKHIGKCDKTNNPATCRAAVQKKIASLSK